MSTELFNRSADVRRLRDEGYFVQIKGGLLIVRDVPYVNARRQVQRGVLISSLNMAGDETQRPDTHVVFFDGEYPCKADGTPIESIKKSSGNFDLGHGVTAAHDFSSKPEGGYTDYHHKMTTYATILAGHARELDPDANPRTFRTPDADEHSVFNYVETASDRVGIGALTERLTDEIIAIIGLGGTGSYILDFVAKTPARQIRLFDADEYLQHNAFRAPGAPTIEQLRSAQKKVHYFKEMYSKMHRGIVAHPEHLTAASLHLLDGVTFAFISMDAGEPKRQIVEKLESLNASFIDVGMGMGLDGDALAGMLRVTASTPDRRDLFRDKVSFTGGGADDVYASNIQVADLNALNAVLAVIKWKKLRGFYSDLQRELHCSYTTDGNLLLNDNQS